MRLAKHLLCVWACCGAAACAEEHEPAPAGDEAARDDVAVREDDDPEVPPTRATSAEDTRATPDPVASASPFASGASSPPSVPPPSDDAGLLCATRGFDPSRSDNSVSLTGPCALRGDWVDLPNADHLRVIVGGVRRASARASDGFRVEADHLTITLLGAACEEVQAGAAVTLEFLCAWSPLY